MNDLIKQGEIFETAAIDAAQLSVVHNFRTAFNAVIIVKKLREALTDDIVKEVFMPLMNTKIGFLTDRGGRSKNQNLYGVDVVRDSIIDAISIGLLPTGNQFNIIAERMYPTKEGYTQLLKKLGVKYIIDVGYDKGSNPNFAEIPAKINAEHNGEKMSFTIVATVKKDSYSSHDQLRGKAERRSKKALYEYITGCDFGEADETSSTPAIRTNTIEPDLDEATKIDLNEKIVSCKSIKELDELFTSLETYLTDNKMVVKMFTARKIAINNGKLV
jgi:hypothetical protein